jgi:hypothetical protein
MTRSKASVPMTSDVSSSPSTSTTDTCPSPAYTHRHQCYMRKGRRKTSLDHCDMRNAIGKAHDHAQHTPHSRTQDAAWMDT